MYAWGKFDESSGRFHRLEHHCADVAACFEALLLDPVLRARFARAAGASDLGDTTAARLTLLAFLHDFGKLNAGFQFKVPRPIESSGRRPRRAGHLAEALLCCDQSDMSGLLGLHRMVDEWGDGVVPLVYAMLAHHGRPARRPTRTGSGPPELWKPFGGYDPRAIAKLLYERGRAWFPAAFEPGPPLPDAPAIAHLFAGTVVLADQLGSDEAAFEYEADPVPNYIERARRVATEVVRSRGFSRFGWRKDAAAPDVRSLFDHVELRPSAARRGIGSARSSAVDTGERNRVGEDGGRRPAVRGVVARRARGRPVLRGAHSRCGQATTRTGLQCLGSTLPGSSTGPNGPRGARLPQGR